MRPATTDTRRASRLESRRRPARPLWTATVLLVAGLVASPVLLVLAGVATPTVEVWARLWETRLPEMLATTFGLLLAVGVGTLILGVGLAWLVTAYSFPGVRIFSWLLVIPLAMPAYVLGFAFLALFGFPGPIQTGWRALFGEEAWFPQVRSLGGAAVVLTLTLYPYVFLLARAALREHVPASFEMARLLGDSRLRAARRVVLPLARPSIAAGLTMVMMETLTDFASVQYFNVQTVSVGVYRIWRGQFDREAALELAAVVLLFALAVVAAERLLRGGMRFDQRGTARDFDRVRLHGGRAVAASSACIGVLTLALGLPGARLVGWALVSPPGTVDLAQGVAYLSNSLGIALVAGVVSVGVALLVAGGARLSGSRLAAGAARLATLGYAVPGPVVAVGVLVMVIALTGWTERFGAGGGATLVVLSLVGLVYAYVVRFLALAYGAVDASLEKITPSLVEAAHTLGSTPGRILRRIQLPLIRSGAAAGAALVAIDALKELPIVLFVRPFGFTTLSVWIWQLASESRWAQAALPSLVIVMAAAVPIHLFARRSGVHGRDGDTILPAVPGRVVTE